MLMLPVLPIQPDSPTTPRHLCAPVSGQSRPGGQHCAQGQIDDPQRWLFIMQHMFDPALQAAVSKCQGADWEPLPGGEPQQGGRVVGPDVYKRQLLLSECLRQPIWYIALSMVMAESLQERSAMGRCGLRSSFLQKQRPTMRKWHLGAKL